MRSRVLCLFPLLGLRAGCATDHATPDGGEPAPDAAPPPSRCTTSSTPARVDWACFDGPESVPAETPFELTVGIEGGCFCGELLEGARCRGCRSGPTRCG